MPAASPPCENASALVLLLAASVQLPALQAQAPIARWTPELAFSVKRVGSVAISPDGRWAAVEVSEPFMEAEPSEWRTSGDVYAVGDAGQGAARRGETPASSPAWSPEGGWPRFAPTRRGKREGGGGGLGGRPPGGPPDGGG